MPPARIPQIISSPLPRIVLYYQTHFYPGTETPLSVLPLVNRTNISVTHVYVAAVHLNGEPGHITLNDHLPSHPRNATLWAELHCLRACSIKTMCMFGGACPGSYSRLDGDDASFEAYYTPLRDFLRTYSFQGIDLDVEEEMSLGGILRLIDRLRADMGAEFLITLAPVARALQPVDPSLLAQGKKRNLSGFDYAELEKLRGNEIAWYNAQFYCGWGDVSKTEGYDAIIANGFPADKVVFGMVTNPAHGSGWVDLDKVKVTLEKLRRTHVRFGGVMGWEYFNSLPGGKDGPWGWAEWMTAVVRMSLEERLDSGEVEESSV